MDSLDTFPTPCVTVINLLEDGVYHKGVRASVALPTPQIHHIHLNESTMKLSSVDVALLLSCCRPAFAAPQGSVSPSAAPPVRSDPVSISHGPYSGTPTTTGALSTTVLASSIAPLPPNPAAKEYPSDGRLHAPQPAPYTPAGGIGTNGTEPIYNVRSDFDYQSLVRYFLETRMYSC